MTPLANLNQQISIVAEAATLVTTANSLLPAGITVQAVARAGWKVAFVINDIVWDAEGDLVDVRNVVADLEEGRSNDALVRQQDIAARAEEEAELVEAIQAVLPEGVTFSYSTRDPRRSALTGTLRSGDLIVYVNANELNDLAREVGVA
jgi:hypothetical protein